MIADLRRRWLALCGVLALVLWSGAALAQAPVRVASKIDTEGALLGNVIIAVLEANGIKTANKLQLGPTNIVRSAIVAGEMAMRAAVRTACAPARTRAPSLIAQVLKRVSQGEKVVHPIDEEGAGERRRFNL